MSSIDVLDNLWSHIGKSEIHGDGSEAARHLAAGRPIYYADPAYPGKLVKKFPDGRRQVVRFDLDDQEIVEQEIGRS